MTDEEIAGNVRALFEAFARDDQAAGAAAIISLVTQVVCDLHAIGEAAKSLAASVAERKA